MGVDERARRLAHDLAAGTGVPLDAVRVVRAPYRFCPLGAHVDHQGGRVTGFALDRALQLAFAPTDDGRVTLRSRAYPGVVDFSVHDVPSASPGDWGNYPRGAARALGRHTPIARGITGLVAGEMHAGGVSTSAALGVACLLALESANELELDIRENVELDRVIENDYIGLANGILDQSVILRARAGALLHLDCRTGDAELHEAPSRIGTPALLAVYSGVEAALVATGFNTRVAECRRAAALLLEHLGLEVPDVPALSDVPEPVTPDQLAALPPIERRRARHYIGEIARVRAGLAAWHAGDIARFGENVTETGRSSIDDYECGSPELIRLYELLAGASGSFGARFSGAGFRGYCMAIVDADRADAIAGETCDRYRRDFPDRADAVHAHVCRWADGAEVVSL